MKSRIIYWTALIAVVVSAVVWLTACDDKGNKEDDGNKDVAAVDKPINISVLLDLSDRISKYTDKMPQIDKDLEILKIIQDCLVEQVAENKIVKATDCLKVFFYPSPKVANMNELVKSMEYDFSSYKPLEKKKALLDMKKALIPSVKEVYSSALKEHNWTGCDIYGFMQSRASSYCIKPGYRNVLIILTDGQIYDKANWERKGSAYSGVTLLSLNAGQTAIIPTGSKLPDLDVMVLEVSADNAKQVKQIIKLITVWLGEMEISDKVVVETDIPLNTKAIIEKFLNDKQ